MMKKLLFPLTLIVFLNSPAFGAGFDLILTYGTRYIGLGGDQIAVVKDAYAPFYNPAGMLGVKHSDSAVSVSNLFIQSEGPVDGNNQQQKGKWFYGPLFYAGSVYRLNDAVALGLAIYPTALQGAKFQGANFGLLGEHEKSVQMMRIEIAPSAALKMTKHLYIGASIRPGFTSVKQRDGVPNLLYAKSKVSNWDAIAVKVGAMIDDWKGLSLALSYRPSLSLSLDGKSTLTTAAGVNKVDSSKDVEIPGVIHAGLAYDWIKDKFLTAFTYAYTISDVVKYDSTRMAGLTATMDAIGGPGLSSLFPQDTAYVPLNYKNAHTFHFGAEYVFHFV